MVCLYFFLSHQEMFMIRYGLKKYGSYKKKPAKLLNKEENVQKSHK